MDSVPPQSLTIFFSRQWSTVITYQGFICSPSSRSAFLRSYLVHGLHADDDVLLAVPVDVPADARLEVLADAVELLGRRDGVVDERLHLVLDEAVLRVGRVDPVHVPLEGRAARRAAAQALRHDGAAGNGKGLTAEEDQMWSVG